MTLPASGPLSLNDIKTEFNGVNPIAMNAYYRNGTYVTGNNTSVPTSGAISISNFYGAQRGVGLTWTQAATYQTSGLIANTIAYGAGIYVIGGSGASITSMYSTDGNTWTTSNAIIALMNTPVSINFVNNKFIALASAYTAGAQSTDGINWTALTASSGTAKPYGYYGIIWDGTNYITYSNSAYGGSGTLVSNNLSSWTFYSQSFDIGGNGNCSLISAFSKIYTISGFGAAACLVYSSSNSGNTWSSQNITSLFSWPSTTYFKSIKFSGTTIFVIAYDPNTSTTYAASSTDGSTWTNRSSVFGFFVPGSTIWAQANWVTTAASTENAYTSTDLSSVTLATSAATAMGSGYPIIYQLGNGLATNGSGQVIAVGTANPGGTRIIKSP